MSDEKIPSLVRIKRVAYFIGKEKKYAAKIAAAGQETHPKGEKFNSCAWEIAKTIASHGIDSCQLGKKEIVEWADCVLFGGPVPVATAQAAATVLEKGNSDIAFEPAAPKPATAASVTAVATVAEPAPVDISAQEVQGIFDPAIAVYSLLLSAFETSKLSRHPLMTDVRPAIERAATLCLRAIKPKA
jgi:hypothetical protein